MKQIVLIDGENFVHSLLNVLKERQPKITRADITSFPIKDLLKTIINIDIDTEIVYFATKLRLDTAKGRLKKKVESTRAFQAKWANNITKQGIHFVKAGYLRVREGEICTKCGHQEQYLLEKGVDVALAVEAVKNAKPGRNIFILSSDTDLLPAIKAANLLGAETTYIGFEPNIIIALTATTKNTRVLLSENILRLVKGKK